MNTLLVNHIVVNKGEGWQVVVFNDGNRRPLVLEFFRLLRDIGYTRGVSAAGTWTITEGDTFNDRLESAKTLQYMQELREGVRGVGLSGLSSPRHGHLAGTLERLWQCCLHRSAQKYPFIYAQGLHISL
jgi:hypothetical protein